MKRKERFFRELTVNKSAKRALSLVLAFAMLIGSLFTANIGVNLSADASTGGKVLCWDGSSSTKPTKTADDGALIITTAAELVWVLKNNAASTTYRVDDGISAFVLQNYDATTAASFMALDTADEVKAWFASRTPNSWSNGRLNGIIDGNGAYIYGMYCKGSDYAGLFSSIYAQSVFKNFGLVNSYVEGNNFAGALAGTGNWGAADGNTCTIEGCVFRDNVVRAVSGNRQSGPLFANGGQTTFTVRNCLVAENYIAKLNSGDAVDTIITTSTALGGADLSPNKVENTIVDGGPPTVGGNSKTAYVNVYSTYGSLTSGVDSSKTTSVTTANMKGINAKSYMANLPWATNEVNGAGYWHIVLNDYPTPIKPDGWKEIVMAPVWSGNSANFTRGNGTEKSPYIIESAEQLYKMVLDGGKQADGTPAYYKVASGVTDIYLNSVQFGDLAALKSLVTASSAKNWTKDFNITAYKQDLDGNGLYDEKAAFTGVFDGNGVTIHGLYSTNRGVSTAWGAWAVGFVPALKDNAVIKNVNFDKSYIENTSAAYSGVITCSFGIDISTTTKDENDNVIIRGSGDTTSATIANVTVRNTYMPANEGYNNGGIASKGGFLGVHGGPKKITFINCVYDGVGSEINIKSDATDNRAGIYMVCESASNATFTNCISIGEQMLTCSRYNSNATYLNCYTTDSATNSYNVNDDITKITEYDSRDDMPALNWGVWTLKEVENGRVVPMPGVSTSNIVGYSTVKEMVLEQVSGAGNFSYSGLYEKGTYGHYSKLTGSGTEADPYLISTPLDLANAISTGGINITNKLYYKLTCDINLGSLAWIDTESVYRESEGFNEYKYVPFQGTLDGNGYTVYELNAGASNSAALIPQLAGGTVKNLHIRNSFAKTAIFATGTGTVENCSAINSFVADNDGALASGDINVINSQFDDVYYINNAAGTPVVDGVVWYQGGGEDCKPQLVSRAKAMPCADVDGDGEGYEYGASDLTALKNNLLKKSAYKNIYGDVSGNGKINTSDLVILTRAITDTYNDIQDGFWRNLALGNFSIYYGENDNYDAARKLELYLESLAGGTDVKKIVSATNTVTGVSSNKDAVYVHANDTVGTPDGKLEIIVGNIDNYAAYKTNTKATDANTYAITYDNENGVLWLQGENFTAVEQAVLDFISNNDYTTKSLYTVDKDILAEEKRPVTIGTTTYYYAWGDEFNGEELVEDNWQYSANTTESSNSSYKDKYLNLETVLNEDINKLFIVEGGKLSMKRGVYLTDAVNNIAYDWDNGYGWVGIEPKAEGTTNATGGTIEADDIYIDSSKIITQQSLLVKQGYFELKASLPSDGHSFPAWWMMGDATGSNNNAYTESLYGKIYKYNNGFKGQNQIDGSNFKETYKYQYPNAYFEFDIIELMQDITNITNSYNRRNRLTGIYDYELPFNAHKYYTMGTTGDGKYYPIDWENNKVMTGYESGISMSQIDNGSESDWIVSHDGSAKGQSYKFGDNASSFTYVAANQPKLTAMRRYGFEWKVEGSSFSYTVYIYDVNGDGDESDVEKITIKDAFSYNEKNSNTIDPISDLIVSNQYMYFLIDNKYYTTNQYYNNTTLGLGDDTPTNFTDLLTKENADDKTCLDIEYMRVYQQDGRRDIVTPETEHFNNGNHFGY